MQKAFIAIALALTLSCVASYSFNTNGGWVKSPVKIVEDSDSNFTNSARVLIMGPLTSVSDLNLINYAPINKTKDCDNGNLAACNWAINYKPIATKDLSAKTNSSYGFKAVNDARFLNGYALNHFEANDSSNNLQIILAQTKLDGGSVLPQVTLTSNTLPNADLDVVDSVEAGKNLMAIIRYNLTYNYTSTTVGGSSKGKEFKFITAPNSSVSYNIKLAWGEALSSSQAYAGYVDGDSYKVAVLDFGSGTKIGEATIAGYHKNMDCKPYVTDKKLYGVWCTNVTTSDDKTIPPNTTVLTTSANTTLAPLFTVVNSTGYTITEGFPYSGHLGFFHTNSSNSKATTVDKQVWDLSTGKTFVNQTNFLTYDDSAETYQPYRIPGAGYYAVVYNKSGNRTNVQVGQIMAGSSLTTVFGFLMTIVAGLFLF